VSLNWSFIIDIGDIALL